MKTVELLQELMRRSKKKPSSLAKELAETGVTQPQLSRFLNRKTLEPKRATLAPVADYYGISVDAFYEEPLASELLRQIESGTFIVAPRKNRAPVYKPLRNSMELAAALDTVADRINEIDDQEVRDLIASRLLTLAKAPDSMKARNAVLESLAWANAATQAEQAAGSTAAPPRPASPELQKLFKRKAVAQTSDFANPSPAVTPSDESSA